jgi:hypothetical protein
MRMYEPDFAANSRTTTAEALRQVYEIFWAGLCRGRRDGKQARRIEKNQMEAIFEQDNSWIGRPTIAAASTSRGVRASRGV